MDTVSLSLWAIFLTFILLAAGFTLLEAVWLSKKGWSDFRKARNFAILSNATGFGAGAVVIVIVSMAILFVAMGSSGGKMPKDVENGIIVAFWLAVLFAAVLLVICKRVFLGLFKLKSGMPAWLYSLVSSVLIFLVSAGVPALIGYFLLLRS